jgi:OmcA/MtrC family decaheme c-type cytochrome
MKKHGFSESTGRGLQASVRTASALAALLLCFYNVAFADKPARRQFNFDAVAAAARSIFGPTGIVVKVNSAAIAANGTITARVTIVDSAGNPLDRTGLLTGGPVSMSLIAATIPAGQTQYVSYTTSVSKATITSNPSQVQAANDSGGTFTQNAIGDYTYTFKTVAPAGFDATATHSIGVSATRDLSEFGTYDEWAETSNDVFNFVPNGSPVTVTRDLVATSSCNSCHNPLFAHGGSRLKVELCVMCHSPQTINADTGLTMDMKVLIHKIHDGASLPSVVAGTPYRIWHRGAWSDFSTVVFPQPANNCTSCHKPGPAQADNWKTNPGAAACGSCHDNVNFATGVNHVNLPVFSDTQCKACHSSQSTGDFDASIPGAHVVANNSASLPGIVTKVIKVDNATPGSSPIVTFSVNDKSGKAVDISKLTQIRVVLGGPNVDYQTGPGGVRVSEDPSKTPGSGGVYTYTMTTKLPAASAGSYTVSIEARNTVNLLPGTTIQVAATDAALPVEFYFSVDASATVARRQVVSTAKCSGCHGDLSFVHGGTRGATQECTICHNPTLVDGTSKQSVSYATQIHSIHRGENLANPYVLGTTNYQTVRFPGDLRDCSTCHVNNSQQLENVGAVSLIASPGGFTPTTPPITAACTGCHDTKDVASHALANNTALGENCNVCHGQAGEFSVDKVHAR